MHEALQFLVQSEQLRHFSVSKCIFSHEKRLRKLSRVPTGQMVLQYVRPLRHANTASTMSVTTAMTVTTVMLGTAVSTW